MGVSRLPMYPIRRLWPRLGQPGSLCMPLHVQRSASQNIKAHRGSIRCRRSNALALATCNAKEPEPPSCAISEGVTLEPDSFRQSRSKPGPQHTLRPYDKGTGSSFSTQGFKGARGINGSSLSLLCYEQAADLYLQ